MVAEKALVKYATAYGKLSISVEVRLMQLQRAYRVGSWELIERLLAQLEDDLCAAQAVIHPGDENESEESAS